MQVKLISTFIPLLMLSFSTLTVHAMEVKPMFGGSYIDGYDFSQDHPPTGSIIYNKSKNEFQGTYHGLKMPKGKRAIFAWLHDTVNQKYEYIGAVGWLKMGTTREKPQKFKIKLPDRYKGGNFGSNEIIAFSSETTSYLNGNQVLTKPQKPSPVSGMPNQKIAYYLFAALSNADTQLYFCGHGKDFFYAKAPDRQMCYDCLCGSRYTGCITEARLLIENE